MTLQGASHYRHSYETKRRLASYWHQVDESVALGGAAALLVGKGSGIVPLMLENQGFRVTTIDLEKELRPAMVTDVRHLPFIDRAFDIALCCEVLEHMPFRFFTQSLNELKRVVRLGVVLSLPDRARCSSFIPYALLRRKVVIDWPKVKLRRWNYDGEHYWEVNTQGHQIETVQRAIDSTGLKTEATYRVWECPYHRFWRLKK
jgi:2-polyprenyl-3-methyl-5-hydroxy-6-metoxy-1,4-benzoquinol methylase